MEDFRPPRDLPVQYSVESNVDQGFEVWSADNCQGAYHIRTIESTKTVFNNLGSDPKFPTLLDSGELHVALRPVRQAQGGE